MRRHLIQLWEDEEDFQGEVRARYGMENMSVFCALQSFSSMPVASAAYGQWSLMMWAYAWLVRRHLSPLWEEEEVCWGEVRAQYGIESVSEFRAFAFVLPLTRCCCCLWAMEILALLLHCLLTQTSFFV